MRGVRRKVKGRRGEQDALGTVDNNYRLTAPVTYLVSSYKFTSSAFVTPSMNHY